ncbi:MAG: RidA family protein [Pseudomonadota bacterium]
MAAVQPPGHVAHFTGQVAWDEHETIVGVGDVEAQTRQCFSNIARILAALGGQMDDVVSITTYYTHPDQLPAIQKVRTEVLNSTTAPVSTSVMVAGLGHPEFLVELTPVAVIPQARFIAP